VTDPKRRALYELVKLFVKSQNLDVAGRALRQRLRGLAPTLNEQRALAASLAPELAEHVGAGSEEDRFRPTLVGLLDGYPPAAEIIDLTLQFFRDKSAREPEFRIFTWEELKRSFARNSPDPTDLDDVLQPAVFHVLDVAGLSPGWFGAHWAVPKDIENLLEIPDFQALLHYREQGKMKSPSSTSSVSSAPILHPTEIFIGHGRSSLWRELKEFLQDRLKLRPQEFNSESVAGRTTQARLQQMLDDCSFAFLIFTGDDEGPGDLKSARPNVIHELGLFQGRLGFERAIVLLEDGCAEFSNIVGLTQIRFPKGGISTTFEEIRRVLERERILPS